MKTDDKTHKRRRRILVICPNWVGDVVMATPLFDCLRRGYAGDELAAVARGYVKGILDPNPWFDSVIVGEDKTAGGLVGLIRKIQQQRPDVSLVLPNSIRAALIARLGGSRKVIGYRRDGRSMLLNGGPRPERIGGKIKPVPMVHYYLKIARWLGLPPPPSIRPQLFFSRRQQQRAESLLAGWGVAETDFVVALNPGAQFGSAKCWPAEHFARLAELLVRRWSCKIILLVGPGEEELGGRIAQLSRVKIIDTGPERIDLATLKPLVKHCRLMITNDTGPRHYAVAMGVPVVVMMGPTDPRYTGANLENTIVLRHDADCAPCHEKTCPRTHACMTAITPEQVMAAAGDLVGASRE